MKHLGLLVLGGFAWLQAQDSTAIAVADTAAILPSSSSVEIAQSSSSIALDVSSSAAVSSSSVAAPQSSSSLVSSSSAIVAASSSSSVAASATQALSSASGSSSTSADVASSAGNAAGSSQDESKDSAQGGSAPKQGFSGSISIGTMTLNGEQVNRISYRPEWTIGSLGIAFDLELFVNSAGNPMSYGWEFDTRDEALNSLYRKIYYVRWNQPGDGFYARVGALENINMDAARLITSNFGNVANYPGQKLVGVHMQVNDVLDPWGLSVELVNNSLEDWAHQGGVLGGKASFKPLGSLGLPVFSNLRTGALAVIDINQLATVSDADGDNCPDRMDDSPNSAKACRYLVSYVDAETLEELYGKSDSLGAYLSERNAVRVSDEALIKNRFGPNDAFTLFGFDYLLPLLRLGFLEMDIYGEWARPYVNDEVDTFDLNDSWGLVPAGAALRVGILDAGLEYRQLQGRFVPEHFGAAYEMERARYMQGTYLTKEQVEWETEEDPGSRKGIYGRASLDLLGFFDVGGSYSHLWLEKSVNGQKMDRGYTASAGLGTKIVAFIPKLKKLEAFYNKNHVGWEPEDNGWGERNVYTTHGYRVGFELGGGMTVIVTNLTSYTRDEDRKLRPQSNFLAETVLSF